MYHSRTKKVASYGRRAHRVVAVSDNGRLGSDIFSISNKGGEGSAQAYGGEPEKGVFAPPARSQQVKTAKNNEENESRRPGATTPKKKTQGKKAAAKNAPARKPLRLCHVNIPKPSFTSPKQQQRVGHGKNLSPGLRNLSVVSPYVDVDIVVLDENGRHINEERRVTKNVQLNDPEPKTARRTRRPTAVKNYSALAPEEDDDDDDEYLSSPQTFKKGKQLTNNPTLLSTSRTSRKSVRNVTLGQVGKAALDQEDSVPRRSKISKNAIRAIVLTDSDSDSDTKEQLRTQRTTRAKTKRPSCAQASRKQVAEDAAVGISGAPISRELRTSRTTTALVIRNVRPTTKSSIDSRLTRKKKLDSATARRGIGEIQNESTSGSHISTTDLGISESQTQGPMLAKQSHSKAVLVQYRPTRPSPSRELIVVSDDDLSLSMDEELELALQAADLQLSNSLSSNSSETSPPGARPIVSGSQRGRQPSSGPRRPQIPSFLRPLLSECGQLTTFDFASFVESFPADPIIGFAGPSVSSGNSNGSISLNDYQKVGEASYSEVFGIGNVVLKIIPLLDEENHISTTWTADWESPPVSEVQDVLKEIVVTRAMGEICKGFIKLIKAHVVQGSYPTSLLTLWDKYNATKGSESVRPDHFTAKQTYAVIILPNGGPDVENLSFSSLALMGGVGWRQAGSIFWQVVRSLGQAEELVHFEHRDLHWGQILVRRTINSTCSFVPSSVGKVMLDDPWHGVQSTIIDLGLSRIDHGQGDSFWTPFDQEIFEGEGDYQYDVYRMMREYNGNEWCSFQPLTNVMWMHYLVDKLLHHKHLHAPSSLVNRSNRKPARGDAQIATAEADRKAYECLLEMEHVLGLSVAALGQKVGAKPFKARKDSCNTNSGTTALESAVDVLRYGKDRRWIM